MISVCSCSDFVDQDQVQRIPDTFIPLAATHSIGQTFVSQHGGLSGIEIWLEPTQSTQGAITLHLKSSISSDDIVAASTVTLEQVSTPGFYRFSFPPQSHSHGQSFYAFLEGRNDAGSLNVASGPGATYLDGAGYYDHQPLDTQLAFRLVYAPQFIVLDLVGAAVKVLGLLLVTALLYVIPGWALLAWLYPNKLLSWAEMLGLSIGFSLAFYPLLLVWTDLVGLHLGRFYAWLPVLCGLGALLWRYRDLRLTKVKASFRQWWQSNVIWSDLTLLLVMGLIFAVRLLVVRTIDVPLWGDSYQHTMMAQLMVDNGGLFDSWQPYTPYQSLTIHFGFPVMTALLPWLTNLGSSQATLLTGQIMNGLAIVTLYPLAVRIAKGNRWAGVSAVVVGGLISTTPAVYVNWGRYAQLSGQAILPVALWFLCAALQQKKAWRSLVLAGITLGGMVLHYYRMPFYYVVFVLAWLVGWGIPEWKTDIAAWGRGFGRLAIIAGVGIGLFLPWGLHLQGGHLVSVLETGVAKGSPLEWVLTSYQDWKLLYLYVPKFLVFIFVGGLVWSLISRRWSVAFIGLWVLGWASLVAGRLLHIPGANMMQHFAIMIALYIPVSMLIGWLMGETVTLIQRWETRWGQIVMSALIFVVALYFARKQMGIIDPSYILVTHPDIRAMAWIREHTSEDARFLIEGFSIYNGRSAVGSDAGWWIPLLTGRDNTIPPQYAMMNESPVDPAYNRQVVALTTLLETTPPTSPEGLSALCDWGITHVYIGQGQGKVGSSAKQLFAPELLLDNDHFQLVYRQDRVYIFTFDTAACETVTSNESVIPTSIAEDFDTVKPIWPHDQSPKPHEVALFRHSFTMEKATTPQLAVFADTRYEIWLDGHWIGRGPARFSKQTREYDVYTIEQMPAGEHLLAVLVQWAPNARRSESVTPMVQVQLFDEQGSITTTDATWKAQITSAWRQDAALVHSAGILGPTELVDLRLLPENWMQPDYVDTHWGQAIEKAAFINTVYQPRSIPHLSNVLSIPTLREMGRLSPERQLYEILPDMANDYALQVITDTHLTLEMLAMPTLALTETVHLDQETLQWQPATSFRPDVYYTGVNLTAGEHQLAFATIPEMGLPFNLSTNNIQPLDLALSQGRHAGHRLLLADPVSQTVGTVTNAPIGVDITFTQTPAYAVFDLGRVRHGRWAATLTGTPGTLVDVGWDERLWQERRPLPHPGSLHAAWNQTDSWILDGTARQVSTIDSRAGRYLLLAVWGDAPVTIRDLRVYEERYPLTQRGTFTSSNPLLNEIWQVGVDTLYVNMHDAYADSLRERCQWWGDAHVAFYMNLAAFGDTALFKRGLWLMAEAFAKDGTPPAFAPQGGDNTLVIDYGMLWVQSASIYGHLTADEALLRELYPTLAKFMAYIARQENADTGLLDIPEGPWSQTAVVDWAASKYERWGQSTVLNALYYKTLLDAAAIAEQLGDEATATRWQEKAMVLKSHINTWLYMADAGRYGHTLVGDDLITEAPYRLRPHPQVWALANGVVPEANVETVTDAMLAILSPEPEERNLEIYGMFWLLSALGQTGHIPEAVNIIETYYGYVLDLGATTWWEHFDSHLRYAASLSHAWGGAPTWFLTTYVLGAQWEGLNTWSVAPAFEGVTSVSGSIPISNYGELTVAWHNRTCEQQTLTVQGPQGTQGQARLTLTDTVKHISLNEQVIWENGQSIAHDIVLAENTLFVPLEDEKYHFEISLSCDP